MAGMETLATIIGHHRRRHDGLYLGPGLRSLLGPGLRLKQRPRCRF